MMPPDLRRLVITGGESTGKTTLAAALAGALGTTWSPEYAREYAETVARPLTVADVAPIVAGQCACEDAASAAARGGVVVHDTDLLSTLVYARHYYGHSPASLEALVASRAPALTLLLAPDLPWVADGIRDRPADREAMQAAFEAALREFGRPWTLITGDDRLAAALEAAAALRTS